MTGGWRAGRLKTQAGILCSIDIIMPQTVPAIVGSWLQLALGDISENMQGITQLFGTKVWLFVRL